jgi:hypothetical protein
LVAEKKTDPTKPGSGKGPEDRLDKTADKSKPAAETAAAADKTGKSAASPADSAAAATPKAPDTPPQTAGGGPRPADTPKVTTDSPKAPTGAVKTGTGAAGTGSGAPAAAGPASRSPGDDLKSASKTGDQPAGASAKKTPEKPTKPEPDNAAPPREKVVERVIERRRSFVPAVIGGIVAAAIGFFAARTQTIDPYLPEALRGPDVTATIEDLTSRVAAQADTIATLQTGLDGVSSTAEAVRTEVDSLSMPDLAPIEERLGAIDTTLGSLDGLPDAISTLGTQLDALDARIVDLEKQPLSSVVPEEAVAAYERELAALQEAVASQRAAIAQAIEAQTGQVAQTIAAQRDEVANLIAEAQAAETAAMESARRAAGQTALASVRAALDDGLPYTEYLTTLGENGVAVPAALSSAADTGVATLAELQAGFPLVARDALAAARAESQGQGGILAYAQRQLSARSVIPKDGDDPDAVLSRVEAAVLGGDLDKAITELDSLPEVSAAIVADWRARAAERAAAIAAVDELAQSLTTN